MIAALVQMSALSGRRSQSKVNIRELEEPGESLALLTKSDKNFDTGNHMAFTVLKDETLEDLQLNSLYILQKSESFRFGMDAVLLSGFVSAKKNQRILDLGTGTGIIPILLSEKTRAQRITGVEIQHDIADMAKRSVDGNHLNGRVEIIEGDIRNITSFLEPASYDIIVSNPPYTKAGSESKAMAKHEICCTLMDVLSNGTLTLKPRGEFYMVHRPDRLTDVLEGMRRVGVEPKALRFVCPRQGDAPSLFLVRGLKNGNPGLKVLVDLIIYDKDGNYTEEARIQYSQERNKAAGRTMDEA